MSPVYGGLRRMALPPKGVVLDGWRRGIGVQLSEMQNFNPPCCSETHIPLLYSWYSMAMDNAYAACKKLHGCRIESYECMFGLDKLQEFSTPQP